LHLGLVYRTRGDYHRAIECLERNVASLKEVVGEPAGVGPPPVTYLCYLVWCLAEVGAFAEAIARGDEGLRLAEALGQPQSLLRAHRGVGYLYLIKGDLQQAIPALERGLALAEDRPGFWPWNAAALGSAYALAGRLAEAIPLLEEAVQRAASMGGVGQSPRLAYLSEACLLAGRLADAQALAEQALTLARQHQERGHEAYALRLLGEIAAHREPPEVEQAETLYRQALAMAEELGMRPLQAHGHRSLGNLYVKSGRRDEAHAELSTAIELYRSMAMTFWLPQAEAALAQVGGR
jgi:tetratricopeptide (TPR) repeat protein